MKMLGDVLAGTVVCRVLAARYPTAEIHYLVNKNTHAVVAHQPNIHRLIVFQPDKQSGIRSFWRFVQAIRAQQYDLVYDLYGKTQSQLISLFSGAAERISYHKWYSAWCYTQTVKRTRLRRTIAGPAIENRLRLIYRDEPLPTNVPLPTIYLSAAEQQQADRMLAQAGLSDKTLIMVSAFGSSERKTWPLAYTAQLLDYLVGHYAVELLLNYLPKQADDAEQLYLLCHSDTRRHIHLDLYADELRLFLALLNRCRAVIGNEGGAINMGKALKLASFSVYAPWIDPDGWGIGEDDHQHMSVHLRDFEADMYRQTPMKKLKPKASELYLKLTPERVMPKFQLFCQSHLSSHFRQ